MKEDTSETVLAKRTVNRIEEIAGTYPGYRRAHAKGELYEAVFTPTGQATFLTTAPHLRDTKVQAIVRFSSSSPNPTTADALAAVKGMSVQFQLSNGAVTNLVGITLPIFVTKSPKAFFDILNTVKSFKDGKPHFKEMVKLFTSYPESRAAFQMIRKLKHTKSYATGHYYAVHAFYLVNEEGSRTPVKFEWEPVAGVETLSIKEAATMPTDYLEAELSDRLQQEEVRFQLHIVIGTQQDPTDDPTKEWPKERQRIEAGVLQVKRKAIVEHDHFIFDPTVLSPGIECSDDEILPFRRDAYAVSFERRKKGQ